MSPIRIVGISGSVRRPSRTTALVQEVLNGLADAGEVRLIELVDEGPYLLSALTRSALTGRGVELVAAIEEADLLVVGSPVYRASYTGALKHVFDLVDYRVLQGKPVVLAATGGTPLHGLMTEHQLRPLFGFFNALTIPTAIYAVEEDFREYGLHSGKVRERVGRAVSEALLQLGLRTDASRHPGLRLVAEA